MPPEQYAPRHGRTLREADCLQRQCEFDVVAVRRPDARAVPHEVGLELLACGCRVDGVHLNTTRIDHQVIRGLSGPGRVQTEADPVIVEDVVALAHRGTNRVWVVGQTME